MKEGETNAIPKRTFLRWLWLLNDNLLPRGDGSSNELDVHDLAAFHCS